VTRNYYELLGIDPAAAPEDIKRAFRREIARYHPDKVQHLGQEFQEIASTRAAALTEAYRVLMDDESRRQYDARTTGAAPSGHTSGAPAQDPARRATAVVDADAPSSHKPDSRVQHARATSSDFVKKAALRMLRDVVTTVAAGVTELPAPGFDAAYVVKGKRALFGSKEPVIRLLARFVGFVDAAAVADAWPLATAATAKDQSGCVLLLGPGVAESKELAAAVAQQRRKARTTPGPVIVPVDVRDWDALLPPEIPPSVRAILQTLKQDKG
jgi:curved DNA-binding protein CbpA